MRSGLALGDTVPADRNGLEALAQAGNQRPPLGQGLLHHGQRQGGTMVLRALPDFGHPQRIRIGSILRDDVAQAVRQLG